MKSEAFGQDVIQEPAAGKGPATEKPVRRAESKDHVQAMHRQIRAVHFAGKHKKTDHPACEYQRSIRRRSSVGPEN